MEGTFLGKIRDFLQRNQIYFEIFSSILLSIMALIVSVNSCQISKQQLANEERLNMPRIKISHEQLSSKEANDSEKIIIENVGGHAYNYNIEKRVFLSCKYFPLNGDNSKQICLPIQDILDTSFPTNNYTGVIESYYTICTVKYFNELYNQARDIKGFLDLQLLKYISISYFDFKDELHEELFIIDGVYQGRKIEKNDKISKLFSVKFPSYRISEIKLEKIIEMLEKKPEH